MIEVIEVASEGQRRARCRINILSEGISIIDRLRQKY
jgi:hypothetical protein